MPSLDRAYGFKGAVIAVSMAVVAGAVHGVMAATFDVLAVKLIVGLAGSIVLIIAGVVSARRSLWGAIATGLLMGSFFFLTRWMCWSVMTGGGEALVGFLSAGPLGWAAWLEAAGITTFWLVEAISMFVPAMIGCVAGQERPAHAKEA
ncbi:MAG: hypothetical protein AAGH68_01615 [Pseudomonadota bacterium]